MEGRVLGLIADDPRTYASTHGALVIDFHAPREARTSVRSWLESTAAIEGCSPRESHALVDATLAKSGLSAVASNAVSSLPAYMRALLALCEAAIVAHRNADLVVVVPEPPIPWPTRGDLRRLATTLLAGCEVVLHAREAFELVPLVGADFVVDESGGSIAPPAGTRSILTRVFGVGDAYEGWRKALDELGVQIAGGPIAHVLAAPTGVGTREILAAAHRAGLDVLECRDAFE